MRPKRDKTIVTVPKNTLILRSDRNHRTPLGQKSSQWPSVEHDSVVSGHFTSMQLFIFLGIPTFREKPLQGPLVFLQGTDLFRIVAMSFLGA